MNQVKVVFGTICTAIALCGAIVADDVAAKPEPATKAEPAAKAEPVVAKTPAAKTPVRHDWPRFRGPHLDGKSSETALLGTWSDAGPKVLWRREIGHGFSGISVVEGRVYTMYDIGESEYAVALDAATGKEIWRFRSDESYKSDQGNGPRATPAIDGDRLYALSARGRLHALSAAKGEVLWLHDLPKEYGARNPTWGVATEPLVYKDLLLVNAGGTDGRGVLAFDKVTGKLKWSAGDDGAGYSSPLPIEVDGIAQLLFFSDQALFSLSPDGKELWRVTWKTDWNVNAATPIFLPPNRLFVSSGYNTGSAMLELAKAEGGTMSVKELWRSTRFKNQFSSSIRIDDHIYGFDNRVFKCINATTGDDVWKQSELGHGSLTYADGHLYVLSESGRLVLVEATAKAYTEKGSSEVFKGKCWTVPTVAGGKLYVRDENELVCFDVAS